MHFLNYVLIAVVILALFGPKTLQSLARSAGKATGEMKHAKDQLVSDPSLENALKLKQSFDKIPTSPQQAARMMLMPGKKSDNSASVPGRGAD